MKNKTTTIAAITIATVLLTSGFGLSSVAAQTVSTKTSIIATVPSTLNNYSVIFQVCAQDTTMRAPEVLIRSDSEVKQIKLNKVINENTCKKTATTIKALDAKTIKIKKVDKTKINQMITAAEMRLSQIKSEISDKNDELEIFMDTLPGNTPVKPINVKKANDISSQLTELRKELKDARVDYYQLLYIIRG